MPMQTICFRIRPDGHVEERVEGLRGDTCQSLTTAVESRLGAVVSCHPTADHYAQPSQQALHQVAAVEHQS